MRAPSRHPARFAAGELDDMQPGAVILDAPARDALAFVLVLGERRARRHFRDHETRAK